ncbi:MAG TPA: hypothetical protein VL498_02445 [Terracidiphilus sp.]|nr:hypothetical protein [Terracidiphilus sp.]
MTALRAFFDGSHDGGGWTNGKHITLAGFAIDETLLPEFEARWNAVLADSSERPAAPYIHMRELRRHHDGIFSNQAGWTDPKRGSLIAHLLKGFRCGSNCVCAGFFATAKIAGSRFSPNA